MKTENESNFENDFIEIIQRKITSFKDKNSSPRKEYEEQKVGSKDRFLIKSNYLYGYKNDARKTRNKMSLKNYLILHDHIKRNIDKKTNNEEKLNYLIKLYKIILGDFRIIPFHVDSYERAFEYFEVLNDRGLDVSALDLIKNRCLQIGNITPEKRNKIFEAWSEIFSITLDHTFNLIQFIRYSYMCEFGHITNKEIYSKYNNLVGEMKFEEILKFLKETLLTRALIFKDLNSNENNLEPKIHNALHLLKSTKTVQWYSLAMAALQPVYEKVKLTKDAKEKLIKLFENIHELMFTLNFTDKVANELEKKLPLISKSIQYNGDINLFVKQLNDANIQIELLKNELGLIFGKIDLSNSVEWVNSFEKNNSLGHMLVFLFKYKKLGSSTNKIYTSSLEHTLPQKPSIDNWSIIENESAENIKRYTYSIGNFYITHTIDNSSYGNKKFLDKKIQYEKDNLYDIIEEGNELNYKNITEWNFEIIKKREKFIINKFNSQFK